MCGEEASDPVVDFDGAKTTDEQAATICRNIAKAFESELTYPGEIKVTVVRESRFTETAH